MNTKWILDDILYAFALVKGPQAEKMMKLIIEKMKKKICMYDMNELLKWY